MKSGKARVTHSRQLTCSYLYSDGTLVSLFEERRDGVQIGQTADVTFGYCDVKLYPSYKDSRGYHATAYRGRIVLHRYNMNGFLPLAKGGKVRAIAPHVDGGSENTKQNNFQVQSVSLETKQGLELEWSDVTSILSSSFTVQADEKFFQDTSELRVGGTLWSDYDTRVMKITDLRPSVETEKIA